MYGFFSNKEIQALPSVIGKLSLLLDACLSLPITHFSHSHRPLSKDS